MQLAHPVWCSNAVTLDLSFRVLYTQLEIA